MNEDSEITKTCESCGASLSPAHIGPCPECGEKEKKMVLVSNETIQIKEYVSRIREFYKKNPKILGLVIAIAVASLLVGWFLAGLLGLGIGIILVVLSFIVPPRVTKVREIERGSP